MFLISKFAGFFTIPSNLIGSIGIIGLGLVLLQWRGVGIRALTICVILLALFGFLPIGNAMLLPLTERFPPWHFDGRAPDGIIVLGGAIDSEMSAARHSIEMDASGERVLAMLELARRFPNARIVYSGGSANMIGVSVPEAPIAGHLLEEFGVAKDRIVLEARSRTTDENARFCRELLAPKPGERWLLVTSAFHMPRAVGAFRAAGFDVEAYPVDWRTRGWSAVWRPFDRVSQGLARADLAAHEWVGLFGYWLTGRSRDLFPSPTV